MTHVYEVSAPNGEILGLVRAASAGQALAAYQRVVRRALHGPGPARVLRRAVPTRLRRALAGTHRAAVGQGGEPDDPQLRRRRAGGGVPGRAADVACAAGGDRRGLRCARGRARPTPITVRRRSPDRPDPAAVRSGAQRAAPGPMAAGGTPGWHVQRAYACGGVLPRRALRPSLSSPPRLHQSSGDDRDRGADGSLRRLHRGRRRLLPGRCGPGLRAGRRVRARARPRCSRRSPACCTAGRAGSRWTARPWPTAAVGRSIARCR